MTTFETTTEVRTTDYDEVTRRGEAWYEQLRPILEPHHNGEAVAIDVETGTYVTHKNWALAGHELRKRSPNAPGFVRFIGPALEREFDLGHRLGSVKKP